MFRPPKEETVVVYKCSNCGELYKLTETLRTPLLLKCAHTCCEECVRLAIRNEGKVICPDCKVESTPTTPLNSKLNNLRDSFHPSGYILTELRKQTNMKPVDESRIGFIKTKKPTPEKQQSPLVLLGSCAECSKVQARYKCAECKVSLCHSCDAEIHSSKVLRTHNRTPLSDVSSEYDSQTSEKIAESKTHLKHCYAQLVKKKMKIETTIKALEHPQTLNDLKKSYIDVAETEEMLKQFFAYSSNIIQNLQQRVMNELHEKGQLPERSRIKCLNDLHNAKQNIDNTMAEVFKALRLGARETNVEDLMRKCENLMSVKDSMRAEGPTVPSKKIEMPTHSWVPVLEEQLRFDFGRGGQFHLFTSSLEDLTDNEVELIMASMQCGFDIGDSVEVMSSASYQISDRSVDYLNECSSERHPTDTQSLVIPPLMSNELYSNRGDYRNRSSCSVIESQRNSSERSYRMTNGSVKQIKGPSLSVCGMSSSRFLYSTNYPSSSHFVKDVKTAPSPRSKISKQIKFQEGVRANVVVCHVQSPSCFYVQLKESTYTLEKYRKFFSKASDLAPLKAEELIIGNLYLAQCSDDNWYRVRFREFVPNSPTIQVVVTQIDTGAMQVVELSRFRKLDEIAKAIVHDAELAIQCSIYECYPVSGMWQQEDTDLFSQVLAGNDITMVVKRVRTNKLDVDLSVNLSSGMTSIRDYMVMSKQACIYPAKDQLKNIPVARECRYFFDKDFKLQDWVDVKIASTIGPDDFYVCRNDPSSNKSFANMSCRLDYYYKNVQNYQALPIPNPCLGLPVAGQFTIDNKWYRAEIISLKPQAKKAEVRYVDFGNTEILPYSRIRMLAEEFIRFTVQSVKCTLSEIAPVNNRYNMLAVKFFAKQVEEKNLRIVVTDIKPDEKFKRDVLHVLLYVVEEEADICVNALMVNEKHARLVGTNLGPVVYPKSKSKVTKEVDTSKETSTAPRDNSNDDSNVDEDGSNISSSQGKNAIDRKTKFEITVVSFVNPNLLYVSLVDQQETIQELNFEMTKFYRDEKNNNETKLETVEVGMKCASFADDEKKWYRCLVREINGEDEFKVFLIDIAKEEVVSKDKLRSLAKRFTKVTDGAIACHMIGVEERTDWPVDICELLKDEFQKYSAIYITYKEFIEGKMTSVPIELFGKRVIHSGPFDPSTEEWTNINTMLLKTLALDEKESEATSDYEPPRENLLKKFDTEIGEVSSAKTVQEWLQKNVEEATAKGVEYSDIIENGEIPPERLFSPNKSAALSGDTLFDTSKETVRDGARDAIDQDWPPAEPLDCDEMIATPSYVDSEFNIYLQLDNDTKTLAVIGSALESKYRGAPLLPVDLYWYPGQICIACFHLDKKWYRGRVKEVEGDKVFVEYVDYGNDEWVTKDKLRKNVSLLHIPIKCHKLPIRSDCLPTSPDGKWPTSILDFVHHTILEKSCRVKLRKEKNEDFYRIETLLTPEKLEIFDVLHQLNYAVSSSSTKNAVELSPISEKVSNALSKCSETADEAGSDGSSSIAAVESVSNLDFSELVQVPGVLESLDDPDDLFCIPQNPQNNEIVVPNYHLPPNSENVTVEVTEILDLSKIIVHVVDSDDESVNKTRKLFLEMNTELQKKAFEQPILKPPYLGRICCTKFEDNLWYRVKITGECNDEENVPILYIDYGNSSTANVNELRQLKRSWFYVPVPSLRCHLLDFGAEDDSKEVAVMVAQLLNNKYKAIMKRIPDSEWYTVKLLEEENA